MGYNKKMQAGGGDEPTRVRYNSRKTARKARRAVRRGEAPPNSNAMPTPKGNKKALNKALRSPFKGGVKKSSTKPKSSFIEPSKELKFGAPKMMAGGKKVFNKKGQYQASGELGPERRRRPAMDEDVYTGVNGSRRRTPATSSDPVTGMSPRQRAQNTPQGSSQKTKQGESVYTESTMDRIGRATVPPGSKKGDGKSTTSKLLDKFANNERGQKSTAGDKATRRTETKSKSETKKTETKKTETKKTSGSSSFGKAFAAARKEGKFTFKWNGKTYGTRRADETIEQHRAAMKKAGGDTPAKSKTTTTETKPTPSSTPKTETKTETKSETKTETTTPKTETKTETPTTPPDRRTSRKEGKEQRKDLKGKIKEARKKNRAKKAAERQGKRVGKLQDKLKKLQGMKAGGMMKYKSGGFPDLTGDGKVTRADILKGRGVIKKNGGKR